jgi:monoamine oxidase
MEAFKAFDFGSGAKNVHIVGEAYSDYQGFIEGALNSCELALAGISPAISSDAVVVNEAGNLAAV